MSQPKTTSQNPSPPMAAERSLSREMYLPRHTPSTSTPPTFALRTPFSESQRFKGSALASGAEVDPPRLAGEGCLRPTERFRGAIRTLVLGQLRPHRFELSVLLERVARKISAPAGFLEAAKRRRVIELVVTIDPDHAGIDALGEKVRPSHVPGPDRRRQTVRSPVGDLQRFLFVAEADAGKDRTEDLLLRDFHPRLDLAEDGWLHKISPRLCAMSV